MNSAITTILTLLLVASTAFGAEGTAKKLKTAKVFFLEALAPKDTTSSERFQKDYESAIVTGKRLTAKKLAACGFELETKTFFYDASDPLQAKEQAEKATKEEAWLMIGPRRSNHYILLAKGAPENPTVSLMASSAEAEELGKLHLSFSPTNSVMAKAAAKEALERLKDQKVKTYVSVISEDCIACKDFAKSFDAHASKLKLVKVAEVKVVGDFPDTSQAVETIKAKKPTFILLPNYSKTSSHVMTSLQPINRNLLFVGSDGWGDSKFGYVQNGDNLDQAKGFTVRGLPPIEQGLKTLAFSKELSKEETPASGPALVILKAIESTTDLLCKSKPKNAFEFKQAFLQKGSRLFSPPWGVSIYQLSEGNLTFQKSL